MVSLVRWVNGISQVFFFFFDKDHDKVNIRKALDSNMTSELDIQVISFDEYGRVLCVRDVCCSWLKSGVLQWTIRCEDVVVPIAKECLLFPVVSCCVQMLLTTVTDLNVRRAGVTHVPIWKTVVFICISASVYLGCSHVTLQQTVVMISSWKWLWKCYSFQISGELICNLTVAMWVNVISNGAARIILGIPVYQVSDQVWH